MKKYLKIYCNWRVHVLTLLVMVAVFLILGECEDMGILILIKVIGFAIAYGTFRLCNYWDDKGKINELNELAEEE